MHLNKIHAVLRRAGLKPYNPACGDRVGYCIYAEQFPYDPVRHIYIYFRSAVPRNRLPLEQAQEAAVAALSAAGVQVEVTETIDGWPAVDFSLVVPRTYRRLRTYMTPA